jgi:oligopeptide/dipeptide ABC transporter ATP-binding protein
MSDVLALADLAKRFPLGGGRAVHAVNGVSLALAEGETIGIVGESGCGKSTLGRLVARLHEPDEGRIVFAGRDIAHLPQSELRALRAELQIVFQNPYAALNPRHRIAALIEEPLRLNTPLADAARLARVRELAERVRIGTQLLARYPHELSGGQLQRVAIARAIATRPRLIVLDEPTSSLDLSVRAGILDLLLELKDEQRMAMLFISHDLDTIAAISDRIAVMYLGRIVEEGPAREVLERPRHPYTQILLSAHLPADPDAVLAPIRMQGEVPSPLALPPGCVLASRCPLARAQCAHARPELEGGPHRAACFRIADGSNVVATAASPAAG